MAPTQLTGWPRTGGCLAHIKYWMLDIESVPLLTPVCISVDRHGGKFMPPFSTWEGGGCAFLTLGGLDSSLCSSVSIRPDNNGRGNGAGFHNRHLAGPFLLLSLLCATSLPVCQSASSPSRTCVSPRTSTAFFSRSSRARSDEGFPAQRGRRPDGCRRPRSACRGRLGRELLHGLDAVLQHADRGPRLDGADRCQRPEEAAQHPVRQRRRPAGGRERQGRVAPRLHRPRRHLSGGGLVHDRRQRHQRKPARPLAPVSFPPLPANQAPS